MVTRGLIVVVVIASINSHNSPTASNKLFDICQGGNEADLQMNIPRGPVPVEVKEFLKVNADIRPELLVCSKHGRWYVEIDHLAPYHWELCRCRVCIREESMKRQSKRGAA